MWCAVGPLLSSQSCLCRNVLRRRFCKMGLGDLHARERAALTQNPASDPKPQSTS